MEENRSTPPAANPPAAPADGKKSGLYYYGSRGSFGGAVIAKLGGRKALRFAETVQLTKAEHEALPARLKAQLVAEKDWPAFVAALKKTRQLGRAAVVPGAKA